MAVLVIGLIFLVIGLIYCLQSKWRKPNAYIPLVIGIVLILIFTVSPISKTAKEIKKVQNLSAEQVSAIILQPSLISGYKNFVDKPVMTSDQALISIICQSLSNTTIEDENYMKSYESSGTVKFVLKEGPDIVIGIKKSGAASRIDVNSDGEGGWHYGILSSKDLGLMLERLNGSGNKQ